MLSRNCFYGRENFRRLFASLSHLFWVAALIDALYIALHVGMLYVCPVEAFSRGMLLSQTAPMVEHVLMSVLLLCACGVLEEALFRS